MTALIRKPTIESSAGQEQRIDEAELAGAAFLARYQGRTLDAYRYDLRAFFQSAVDEGLVILSATRPQIELIVERHRSAATVVTSNREPVEWLGLMADPLLAQSAIDRLQSAAYELVLEGESYRRRQKPGLSPIDPPPPSPRSSRRRR